MQITIALCLFMFLESLFISIGGQSLLNHYTFKGPYMFEDFSFGHCYLHLLQPCSVLALVTRCL